MKKIILLITITVFITSCKKKENTINSSSDHPASKTDQFSVTINSNYNRTIFTVENITDQIVVKRYNLITQGDSARNMPLKYSFTMNSYKKYRIYSYSIKNASDTTYQMLDNKLTWNYMKIIKNGSLIYEYKDTIGVGPGYGANRMTSNEVKINY